MITNLSGQAFSQQSDNYNKRIKLLLSFVFLLGIVLYSVFSQNAIFQHTSFLIAAVLGGYLALAIGANDIANTMGPTVGAKAITMPTAIAIAVVFEVAGAVFAGGDVVSTIKTNIINADAFANPEHFIWLMLSALAAAAIWLSVATTAKAPVSTTQAIIGGIVGAGIAAEGVHVVDWLSMLKITTAWVLSPIIGAGLAALLLLSIHKTILNKTDKLLASYRWVPIYVSLMVFAFLVYVLNKLAEGSWLQNVDVLTKLQSLLTAEDMLSIPLLISIVVALTVFFVMKATLNQRLKKSVNQINSVNQLFTIPIIFAAAMMSFAHGSNDVANVVGPVSAIAEVVSTGVISDFAHVPLWLLMIGALGIAVGLSLFGPRLIRVVGSEITRLDQVSAFAVVFSVAITVIIASHYGLPVSSTFIAIGGIFGVGFLHEWLSHGKQPYVQRDTMKKMITAWVITVPCSAVIAAIVFYNIAFFFSTDL